MSNLSDYELSALGSQLRTLFIKRKKQKYPGYKLDARSRAIDSWNKIAAACSAAGADPRDWIEAAFMYDTVYGGPWPNALAGKAMARWYTEYCKKTTEGVAVGNVEAKVRFDFAVLRTAIQRNNQKPEEEQQTLEELVLDPLNKIQPYIAVTALPNSTRVTSQLLTSAREYVRGSMAYLDAIHACGVDPHILIDRG